MMESSHPDDDQEDASLDPLYTDLVGERSLARVVPPKKPSWLDRAAHAGLSRHAGRSREDGESESDDDDGEGGGSDECVEP